MRRLFLSGMRGLFLILISIVLMASLFGVYQAFTLPAKIEEQIAVLNYEHKGEFDYLVHLNASYLFGNIPLETSEISPKSPPSNPKYPTEMIGRFNMTFSYWFVPDKPVTKTSGQVEVKAVLDKPAIGREEVILVPTTTRRGDFTAKFSLDENELALCSRITITAEVYTAVETDTGPIFESFTQSLTMRSKGPLLEVDKGLTSTQRASFGELSYEQIGNFDYSVRLKPDSPFGAITLKPPTSVTPLTLPTLPSSKTLGPGEPLFSQLIDRMDVTFSYQFESDRPVSQIAEEVEINAVLENPDVWSKTFVLVPPTEKSGDFTVTFHLDSDDFSHFSDVFRTIERETGVSGPHNLTIKADIHTVAQTDFGPIDEEFSQTLSTTLGEDILEWEEELVDSKPGAIEMSRMTPNPNKFVGLSVSAARIVFPVITGILLALGIYLLMLYMKFKPEKFSPIEEEALRARKKYKGLITDIKELPEAKAREMIIQLSSLDELIKAADSLLKPVLHKAEKGRHTYCVLDTLTRYEYISEVEPPDKDKSEQ